MLITLYQKTAENLEGHIWHQYTVFRARRITFFLVNQAENQNEPKRQQWWLFGFVFVFNGLRQWEALIIIYTLSVKRYDLGALQCMV